MNVIFRCVDISQMLFTFQKFILDLISKNGGMGGLTDASPSMVSRCKSPYFRLTNSLVWHNVAMTFELTLVCFVLFRNVIPEKSIFFAEKKALRQNGNAVPMTDL